MASNRKEPNELERLKKNSQDQLNRLVQEVNKDPRVISKSLKLNDIHEIFILTLLCTYIFSYPILKNVEMT